MKNLNIKGTALISDCKKYRYILSRVWDSSLPSVTFLMLNPSTADETNDDPTIRRCIAYAKRWGFGHLDVVNLFAYRATNPKDLLICEDPIGDMNKYSLFTAAKTGIYTVCAWGNSPIISKLMKKFPNYKPLQDLENLKYLELSKDGTPKHPLYLKKNLEPLDFI